jgi:hypothetical protein
MLRGEKSDAVLAAVECGVEFRQAAAPRRSIERRPLVIEKRSTQKW